MQRKRYRVITKSISSHGVIDRHTGATVGLYSDWKEAVSIAQQMEAKVEMPDTGTSVSGKKCSSPSDQEPTDAPGLKRPLLDKFPKK